MEKQIMSQFKLSEELVNSLLSYLGTKPYQESARLIHELQQTCNEQLQQEQNKEEEV